MMLDVLLLLMQDAQQRLMVQYGFVPEFQECFEDECSATGMEYEMVMG